MNNSIERVLISEEKLKEIVSEVAQKINSEFGDEEVLLVIILKGSIVFATDLMRKLDMPVMIDFMQASSYGAGTQSTRVVNIKLDLKADIEGKNVILIEDIIDSGNTLRNLKAMLLKRNPKTLRICTLLDKPERRETEIEPDYVGTAIPDEFVVGYGLDYNENFRELPYIGVLSRHVYE
ncbi:MAG: hypoxanthine phosphoribosyltransferase [Clostridia bacterium]|nr:hypoxanthine phosphoribosyltransferase [Clostridia bacterium]